MNQVAGRKCIAIAYSWRFVPTVVKDFDIMLTVSTVQGIMKNSTPESLWKYWSNEAERSSTSFRVQLPKNTSESIIFDVSGLLGLLGPQRVQETEQANAFERVVADVLMWELSKLNLAKTADQYPLILLQGPLLPKLRGRLYYRCLDPEIPLLCTTFQTEWVARMLKHLQPITAQSADVVDTELKWEGPLPSLSLDAGSRTFIGFQRDKVMFHVEFVANAWDPSSGADWWEQRGELCKSLFSSQWQSNQKVISDNDMQSAILPMPLACARLRAADHLINDYQREIALANWLYLRPRLTGYPLPNKGAKIQPHSAKPIELAFLIERLVIAEPAILGQSHINPKALPKDELRQLFFNACTDPKLPKSEPFENNFAEIVNRLALIEVFD